MALTTQHSTTPLGDQLRHTRDEATAVRGELSSIGAELRELFRLETELAKAETSEATSHATKGATYGAIGAVFGLITAIFLFLTIMFALDEVLPLWAAALVTTLIALVLAGIFMLMSRSQLKQFSPMPKRFAQSLQEDIQWARSQLKFSMR
jgi:uncharacterized membrane protein YqjE